MGVCHDPNLRPNPNRTQIFQLTPFLSFDSQSRRGGGLEHPPVPRKFLGVLGRTLRGIEQYGEHRVVVPERGCVDSTVDANPEHAVRTRIVCD